MGTLSRVCMGSVAAMFMAGGAQAGPTVVNELQVFQSAQAETESGVMSPNPVHYDATGAAALVPYFQTIGANLNLTTVSVKGNVVHMRGDAAEPLPGSPDFVNTGDANARVSVVDSLTVTVPATIDFQVIADGTFTAGLIQVNGAIFDLSDRFGASFGTGDVNLISTFQSLRDFPSALWDAQLSLVPGDVYEFGYTLSMTVSGESSQSLGVIGSSADYSNTGGFIIQELGAGGAPVVGNPDLVFGSGLDYSTLDRGDVPEAPAGLISLTGLASLGVATRLRQRRTSFAA